MQTPEDRYLEIGGVKIRYWAAGDHGRPVVLIHGLGGFAEHWMYTVPALQENYRVFVPDLVGFGKSDKPEEMVYNVDHFAAYLRGFMIALDIPRATLVGNSMGGAVALQIAFHHSEMVDRLALVDSGGLGKELSIRLRLATLPVLGEMLTAPDREQYEYNFKNFVYRKEALTPELVDLGYQIFQSPGTREAFLRTLRKVSKFGGQAGTALDRLAEIQPPTLILWGREDSILPVKQAIKAKEYMPEADLVILSRCGHLPMLECPEEFNEELICFLEEC